MLEKCQNDLKISNSKYDRVLGEYTVLKAENTEIKKKIRASLCVEIAGNQELGQIIDKLRQNSSELEDRIGHLQKENGKLKETHQDKIKKMTETHQATIQKLKESNRNNFYRQQVALFEQKDQIEQLEMEKVTIIEQNRCSCEESNRLWQENSNLKRNIQFLNSRLHVTKQRLSNLEFAKESELQKEKERKQEMKREEDAMYARLNRNNKKRIEITTKVYFTIFSRNNFNQIDIR